MPDKITIMGNAFQRASQKRTLYEAPPNPKPFSAREDVRQTLADDRAKYENLNDDDLAFEAMTLAENVESIRIELRLEQEGEVERPVGWRPRAERAVNLQRTRLAICKAEQERRRRIDSDQRRIEEERRGAERRAAHQEFLQTGGERRQERLALERAAREENSKPRRFVRLARKMLPAETFMAIWNAVDDEVGNGQQAIDQTGPVRPPAGS